MAENISPEERLFKVIQQGKDPDPGEKGPGDGKFGGWLRGLKRLISSIGSAHPERKKGFDWNSVIPAGLKLPELEPGAINKILAIVLVIVLALTAYLSSIKRRDTMKITDAVSKIQIASAAGKEKMEPLKKVDFYIDEIRKRDIFRPAPKEAEVETKQAVTVSDSLKKEAESLKLQGIAWGPAPKAMILWQKDKESNMYFLMKGQAIGATGIRVKEIYKDKVVIGDDKEEVELL
jgi:hypothetical protein